MYSTQKFRLYLTVIVTKLDFNKIDYAKKIVERFGQQNCKPTRTPLPAGYKPSKIQAKLILNKSLIINQSLDHCYG